MKQPLAIVPTSSPDTALPPSLSRTDDLTRALLSNGREVAPDQRQRLVAHLDRLNRSLSGSPGPDIVRHVAVLRSAMAKSGGSAGQEEQVLLTYAAVLSELPLWAVSRACSDFLHGRVGEGRFAPTPAEIAIRCRTLMSRYVEERAKIERALGIAGRPAWEGDLS